MESSYLIGPALGGIPSFLGQGSDEAREGAVSAFPLILIIREIPLDLGAFRPRVGFAFFIPLSSRESSPLSN